MRAAFPSHRHQNYSSHIKTTLTEYKTPLPEIANYTKLRSELDSSLLFLNVIKSA